MADVSQADPTAAPASQATDDWRLNPYKDILAREQLPAGDPNALTQVQTDALARLRAKGTLAPLDQMLQAQAPPTQPNVASPNFVNAPTATMDNPDQGAADQASFNPTATLLPNPTYRPFDTGLADRLGLVPLNPRDVGTQHEFGTRLLESLHQLPRALESHPLTTGARMIGNTLAAPGSVLGAAAEENQGSNVGNAVAGGTDILNALLNPPGSYAVRGVGNAIGFGGRSMRGLYRLLQMLQQVPQQSQMPPAAPPTQGPLPPTGPQSPYYVPPGSTFH